jgi:bifunctional UDP-N-acetylglucosamine pyrophosphorylase / glucosamine-1-phosphate N-acetyltransferase
MNNGMNNIDTRVVILAAGLGTRMRSKRAKVLHRAGGMTLIEHVSAAARAVASAESIVIVTGHQAEHVENILGPMGVRFVRQTEQKGTGHALECARLAVTIPVTSPVATSPENGDGLVMVLYGDTPLLSAATLKRLRDAQARSDAAATLITTTLADPSGYGRVILDADDGVRAIVEERACTADQRAIRIINSGIYCFRAGPLWEHLAEIEPNNSAHEYYLTDMAAILSAHGYRVEPLHIDDPAELLGINTRIELADADRILRRRKADEVMLSGVTIERPETVSIDTQVCVGEETIIEPFARLLGSTTIGEDCHIGAGSILENTVLGDHVVVKPYSMISDSRVETGAQIGPFARLRMNAEIGENARIGNFVEVKKSRVGKSAKAQHLAYLGDAHIGDRVNIGAGTITCNYDGEKKHETSIGVGAFIGSNSTLVAPIEIGADSYVGAGSVVTGAVPDGALAIGRGRQVNKEGWAAKRKKK